MGFLTGKKATSAPWFVIQWTASLEKWIYWHALCGGMKVSPYLGDAICSTIQLLIRSFEKSEQKNIHTRLEFWWWERWIQKGGGIRRAQAEPACGCFLSQQCSAVSYTTSTTCCCLVREILEPKLLSNHMHSWFFTELEGKFHFWPRRCVRPHGEGVDMFGFTPGSASPLFACT